MNKSPQPEEQFTHGWSECHNRFPLDIRLRAFSYRIVSRPAKGEAMWAICLPGDDPVPICQSLALQLIADKVREVELAANH